MIRLCHRYLLPSHNQPQTNHVQATRSSGNTCATSPRQVATVTQQTAPQLFSRLLSESLFFPCCVNITERRILYSLFSILIAFCVYSSRVHRPAAAESIRRFATMASIITGSLIPHHIISHLSCLFCIQQPPTRLYFFLFLTHDNDNDSIPPY